MARTMPVSTTPKATIRAGPFIFVSFSFRRAPTRGGPQIACRWPQSQAQPWPAKMHFVTPALPRVCGYRAPLQRAGVGNLSSLAADQPDGSDQSAVHFGTKLPNAQPGFAASAVQ